MLMYYSLAFLILYLLMRVLLLLASLLHFFHALSFVCMFRTNRVVTYALTNVRLLKLQNTPNAAPSSVKLSFFLKFRACKAPH
jgi:hypothetical protein